jgi:para-nitrobenzyl esterase
MREIISKDINNVSADQLDNQLDRGPAVTFTGGIKPKKSVHRPGTVGNGNNLSGPGVVKTEGGYISGIDENGILVYLGIPYAAPPTGDLRWKPPEPAKPWKGVLRAENFSPSCPQAVASDFGPEWTPGKMDEDCLYLNVWTPANNSDDKLPVMVFIYGGAYVRGSSALPLYNGTELAKKGVVVVTFNYRVGVLGYMAHPQLSEESPYNVSGNYGLLDQEAALKWVQENIAAFGGDPDQVTIFGESAGGASIISQLAIPQSRGLYKQAIVESGAIWKEGPMLPAYKTKAEAEDYGLKFAESLGCSGPDAIKQMRSKSAFELANETPYIWNSTFWGFHYIGFKPTIDGWLIKEAPEKIFRQGKQNPVPLIIGSNADEGTTIATNVNISVAEYEKFIRDNFGENASLVLARYPASSEEEVQHQMERLVTDFDFASTAKFVARSMSEVNENTYLYKFTYALPGQPYGAYHTSDLYFVFRPDYWKPDPESSNVSDYVMDLWIRFARTGDPNGGINVTWPRYDPEKDQYLEIGTRPAVKNGY